MFINLHKKFLETAVKLDIIKVASVLSVQHGGIMQLPLFPLVMYKMAAFENLGLLIEYTNNVEWRNLFLLRILDACEHLSIKTLYSVQGDLARSKYVQAAYAMYTTQKVPVDDIYPITLMFAWLLLKTIAIYGDS